MCYTRHIRTSHPEHLLVHVLSLHHLRDEQGAATTAEAQLPVLLRGSHFQLGSGSSLPSLPVPAGCGSPDTLVERRSTTPESQVQVTNRSSRRAGGLELEQSRGQAGADGSVWPYSAGSQFLD